MRFLLTGLSDKVGKRGEWEWGKIFRGNDFSDDTFLYSSDLYNYVNVLQTYKLKRT